MGLKTSLASPGSIEKLSAHLPFCISVQNRHLHHPPSETSSCAVPHTPLSSTPLPPYTRTYLHVVSVPACMPNSVTVIRLFFFLVIAKVLFSRRPLLRRQVRMAKIGVLLIGVRGSAFHWKLSYRCIYCCIYQRHSRTLGKTKAEMEVGGWGR